MIDRLRQAERQRCLVWCGLVGCRKMRLLQLSLALALAVTTAAASPVDSKVNYLSIACGQQQDPCLAPHTLAFSPGEPHWGGG